MFGLNRQRLGLGNYSTFDRSNQTYIDTVGATNYRVPFCARYLFGSLARRAKTAPRSR